MLRDLNSWWEMNALCLNLKIRRLWSDLIIDERTRQKIQMLMRFLQMLRGMLGLQMLFLLDPYYNLIELK